MVSLRAADFRDGFFVGEGWLLCLGVFDAGGFRRLGDRGWIVREGGE